MKHKNFLRLLGIIVILTVLLAVVPLPALAVESLMVSPANAKVGDRVNFSGAGYTPAPNADYYLDIFMSDQTGIISNVIDVNITRYFKVVFGALVTETGSYSGYFIIPASLNQGAVGASSPLTVTPGVTYSLFATNRYNNPATPGTSIRAIATLTITPSATLDALQPATGPAGTVVSVSGGNFPASTAIAFLFDGTAVTPTSGDSAVRASGIFISTLTIPSTAAAGSHTITVTAGSSTATTTFTVTAAATLTLSPTTGAPGTPVAMSGANFPAGTISVTFDGAAMAITGGSTATSGGAFASFVAIPSTATTGAHTIVATVGSSTGTATFTVTGAPTTTPPTTTPPVTTPPTTAPPTTTPAAGKAILSINSSGHNVGAQIGIGGAGFNPGATVTIKYDDTPITTVKVETNGTFISSLFTAPPGKAGNHTITATDGINTSTTIFTITATTPKVPPPLKPELGAKVKSPISFTWSSVIDDNLPMSYRLQISLDRTFAAAALVDVTGIKSASGTTTVSYTLSSTEAAKLSVTTVPYYWRVKAIDAALSESDWTGASTFYAQGPFVFPKWALYASIAGGALVLFLIGLFIGRRTAFYY